MSDLTLRRAIGVLAILGIAVAGYLTYTHYAHTQVLCLASGSCETVQKSKWAELFGVPVAVIGLGGYVAILASTFIRGELGKAITAGLAIVGVSFALYLSYRELFSIHAICHWCATSQVLLLLITGLSIWRVLRLDVGLPVEGPEPEPAPPTGVSG